MTESVRTLVSGREYPPQVSEMFGRGSRWAPEAGLRGARVNSSWNTATEFFRVGGSRRLGSARSVAAALPWLAAFAAAEYFFSFPQLAPTIPHTVLRLVSVPLALLGVALIIRPVREAPFYAVIFAGISLSREIHTPHAYFSAVRIAIETAQMVVIVWLLFRHFYHRLKDPLIVAAWGMTVLAVTAASAFLMAVATATLPLGTNDYTSVLGGSLEVAWRYWWLSNDCSFLVIAGPIATLIVLRSRLRLLLTTPGTNRRRFIGVTIGLVLSSLFAFPVFDMSWRGFPPDLLLALQLIPVPFAMALAARYRANGAAIATLILTVIAVISVTGPAHAANWQTVPPPATPTQTLLLITGATCSVVAGISRQLKLALNEAIEASQAKSRFIAMLNHELRTPLNAILGFSELMRLQSMRALGDALAPVENIHASGQRLLAMIEGLLEQADRGASVFELTKEPLGVAQAIAAVSSELAAQIAQFGCKLEVDADKDLIIDADPRAFRQMLLVLLNYALRFVGSETLISVSAVHIGTDTVIEVASLGLINAADDDRDKLEVQLVKALALGHGARLTILDSNRTGRIARLTFFATRAAA